VDINVALAIVRREVRAYYGGDAVDMSALVDAAASIDAWLSRVNRRLAEPRRRPADGLDNRSSDP
jgi:phage gp36-like protein